MKTKLFLSGLLLSQFLLSCHKESTNDPQPANTQIAIVSDIHYMHPSLLGPGGSSGVAFQNYLNQDPKLVEYSDPIWQKVMGELKQSKPNILLIPGDITKDGEKIGHQAMAAFLNDLESKGITVYVIPGNHDINNAKAKRYVGDNAFPVEMTSKADFANIYENFGYNTALSRDPASLSYVAQLKPGLRLLAIDASKYEEYDSTGDVAAGRIKPQTLTWILSQMLLAKQEGQEVYGMMHQNLIEHYQNQSQLDPGYVVDDWQTLVPTLMDAGLKVIFTGHYHANDISSYVHNGSKLYDIETGSLVTAPCPYRIITLKEKTLEVKSTTVQSVGVGMPGGISFPAYTNSFLSQHLDGYFNYYLSNVLGAPAPVATFAAPLFRNGIMAHFAGDEHIPADQQTQVNTLSGMSATLAGFVTILWTDTGEPDNNTDIHY